MPSNTMALLHPDVVFREHVVYIDPRTGLTLFKNHVRTVDEMIRDEARYFRVVLRGLIPSSV